MAPIDFEFQIQVIQPHPAFIVEPLAGRFINVMTTTRAKPIKSSLLPSATKLRRLCFYTCLSVHRGSTWAGTPRDQVHPQGPGTPPRTRYTPWDQVHPPGPGTPPQNQVPPTPWDQVHPPGPDTTPRDQVHPPGTQYTPPPRRRLLLRTVRILLECILVFICFGFHVEASFHMTSSRNHSNLHGTIKTSIESAPSM